MENLFPNIKIFCIFALKVTTCNLTYSDDGGHSYITPREASLGVIGQRKNRVMFSRLGQSRDRVYKVFSSAPVKTVFISGFIELEALNT